MFLDHPRGFRDPSLIVERLAMLDSAQATLPLREWAADLSRRVERPVPQFDPADAGVDAKMLLLFEAPGPMAHTDSGRRGSGFISADNNDATAEAVWRGRDAAGLAEGVLAWNIVPWYLGVASVKPDSAELAAGAGALLTLLPLLPYLEVVVLAGRFAQRGWKTHVAPMLPDPPTTVDVWHPSPLSLNQPGRRAAFNASLVDIAAIVSTA